MSSPNKKTRKVVKFFSITFDYGADTYAVIPLDPDPDVATKAFRLRKQTGDRQIYDVRLTDHGVECDCPGFIYRCHCKHLDMLRAAHMLD